MDWRRFHFTCRQYLQQLKQGNDIGYAKSLIRNSMSPDLYGKSGKKTHPANEILRLIEKHPDPAQQQYMLETYASANFNHLSQEINLFKRGFSYLLLIGVMFAIIVMIHRIFIYPQFVLYFSNFDVAKPSAFEFFNAHKNLFTILPFIGIFVGFMLNNTLLMIAEFRIPCFSRNIVYRLLPSSIRKTYQQLNHIVGFPASINNFDEKINCHLNAISRDTLSVEMTELTAALSYQLHYQIKSFSNIITGIAFCIVLASLITYMVGVYSPLFILGQAT